ncbi:coiled-coil domain-containing protein 181 isoform X4 [Erinaceus europaeus]|uniref:Coiled-coil domain-containing protein 181 n=1 Tax=Erinaceus europaeus TaxID=9365 RepID=A0ABM3XYN6_ERIEU|nr:coiled-coil domain-containing protein 181 isoform X4 [Erinaceus europaeus]
MDENKKTDSKESGEYEDDFEKDLEWLINEKERSDASIIEMVCRNEENIYQEFKENETEVEHTKQLSDPDDSLKDEVSPRRNDFISVPSSQPLDPASDSDSENSFQESKLEIQNDLEEDEDEEVRRYIMEKIIQANKLLQNQEPVNNKRERKLKFKDKLVDLEVPPLEDNDIYKNSFEDESNISGKLSQLHISSEIQENVLLSLTGGSCEENKDGKILVERDGKFELLNLQDIESQGFLSPLNNVHSIENDPQQASPRPSSLPAGDVQKENPEDHIHSAAHSPSEEPRALQPSLNPKTQSDSVIHFDRNKGSGKYTHKTQSVNLSLVSSTYCLSPRQKELQKRLEQKREKLKREENRDPQQAFRLWLKKKHEEQLKERKTEELRKQEECLFFLRGTEGRERAFQKWLRRKRIEKLAEQQAVKERARQLRLEARRSKQFHNHMYMSEGKSFRFTDHYN